MRHTRIALIMLMLLGTLSVYAQNQPSEAEMQEMMKKWMEAASPNEHHKALDPLAGKWELATSTWMNGPDAPPTVSKATAEMAWMLDGRFMRQDSKGEFMGQPYTGFGLTGYDNMKKCYTMLWVDNTSTAIYAAEGNFDKSGKNLVFYGKMDEPMTGEHNKNVKYVLRMIDKDKFIFEVHDLIYGENKTKMMEIAYTRVK